MTEYRNNIQIEGQFYNHNDSTQNCHVQIIYEKKQQPQKLSRFPMQYHQQQIDNLQIRSLFRKYILAPKGRRKSQYLCSKDHQDLQGSSLQFQKKRDMST